MRAIAKITNHYAHKIRQGAANQLTPFFSLSRLNLIADRERHMVGVSCFRLWQNELLNI